MALGFRFMSRGRPLVRRRRRTPKPGILIPGKDGFVPDPLFLCATHATVAPMKRNAFLLLLAALLSVSGILWAQHRRAAPSNRPTFKTASVQPGDITQRVTTSGTLSALTTVTVGSQVSGNIAKLHVDYNAVVTAGQLLAEIEPSTYQARLVQAEADLLSAQATLELKQLNARRLSDLLGQTLVAQADYDEAAATLRQQEAQTRKAEAAVQNARVDLERCKITSPIDGVVLSRAVDVGQTVQANFSAPTLFTLAQDLRQMQITANVSEADVGSVATGQSATFTVDAFPGRTFHGTVREVRNNSTTTSNVVTYPTIIVVDNSELKLRPGMTANVTLTTAQRTHVLRVPNAALRLRVPANAVVRAPTDSAAPASAATVRAAPLSTTAPVDPPREPSLDQMPAALRTRVLADFDRDGDGTLDETERTALREKMRARFAAGERPPPPSAFAARPDTASSSSPRASSTQQRTIYVLAGEGAASGSGELVPTVVQIGLADTTYTEIVSGVSAGAIVATGTVSSASKSSSSAAASPTATNNPFTPARPPAGGPPPR